MIGTIQREELPTLITWMFRVGLSGLFVMILYSGWEIRDQQLRDRHQDRALQTAVERIDDNIDRLEAHQRFQDDRLSRHRRRMGRIQALIREGLIKGLIKPQGQAEKLPSRYGPNGSRVGPRKPPEPPNAKKGEEP